jgi:lipopolysaccharide/colanic/teichoic acid biosynthesis glycosyltransferase
MSTLNPGVGEITVATGFGARRNRGVYASIKPWADFVLALLMLALTAPIILIALFMVRLNSRGPWIYVQKRLGRGGRVFTIYKIRTMYHESERLSGPQWCVPGDPRVTPVGRLLRYSHIDELPQLVNVLLGHMSLIGPRPERPEFLEQLERAIPNYRCRLAVRPGLTGLAQVQHASDTDLASVRRKLDYDLYYIEWMNPWLDFRLVVGTVFRCLGIPAAWIGRILQLPDPTNLDAGDRSAHAQPDLAVASLMRDQCLG